MSMNDQSATRLRNLLGITLVGLFATGCASARSRKGFDSIQQMVDQRTGAKIHWDQGTQEDEATKQRVRSLLGQPLTVDNAVAIALVNNPSLQATFEEIGIAQADLVQAGLLENPVFAGSVRFPQDGGHTATQFSVSQNFLDLIALPLRRRAAQTQFRSLQLQVADNVLMLEAAVRDAFYTVQGAQQMLGMRKKVLEATLISKDLAETQHKVGNLSALDLTTQQMAYHQAEIDLDRDEAELAKDRERLSLLLGIPNDTDTWTITAPLPDLVSNDPDLKEVEQLALDRRLDLDAARQETVAFRSAITATRFGSGTSGVSLGIETEKDAEGVRATGPTFSLPIPVFDRNQSAVAKSRAKWRQSQKRLEALEASVKSEVRLAFNQLGLSRHIVEYSRANVLPIQEQIVKLSQQHYNFMLLGVYQLILARQNEIIAQRDYINGLRDYWMARTELEKVVGGRLELSNAKSSEPAQPPAPKSGLGQ